MHLAHHWSQFCTEREVPNVEVSYQNGQQLVEWFSALPWGDTWEDAGMLELLVYLYGNSHMHMPRAWKNAINPWVH